MNVPGNGDVSLANLSEIFIYLEFEQKTPQQSQTKNKIPKHFFFLVDLYHS